MREERINELKDYYYNKTKENDKAKTKVRVLKERRDILEKNILVKQYIELQERIKTAEEDVLGDMELLSSVIDHYEALSKNDIDNSDNIYVYLGTYVFDHHNNELQLNRNDGSIDPDYNLYGNIASGQLLEVAYEDFLKFEKDNNVVISSNYPTVGLFDIYRYSYFDSIINEGEEKAKSKILKRTIKK